VGRDWGRIQGSVQRRINAAILQQTFRRFGDCNLGFLRVCKLINFEAAEIFYGENKFRFSGTNGHMAAYAFVTKIGPRNLNLIKALSIAAPLTSNDRGIYGENWNPSGWMRVHEIYDRMPFSFPRDSPRNRWRYPRIDFAAAWCMLVWKLTTADRLEDLNIVLPNHPNEYNHYYGVEKRGMIWSAFDDLIAAKPFLEMHATLVMDTASDPTEPEDSHLGIIGMLKELGVCRVHLAVFGSDDEGGVNGLWMTVPQPYVDKRGRFTLDQDLDHSVEVVDVLPDIARMFEDRWAKD
jgi:hypothetical protein